MDEFVYQPKNKAWVTFRSTIFSLTLHGVLIFGTAFVAFEFLQDLKKTPVVNIKLANHNFDSVGKASSSSDQQNSDNANIDSCLLYTSPSPRDVEESRMPSSA